MRGNGALIIPTRNTEQKQKGAGGAEKKGRGERGRERTRTGWINSNSELFKRAKRGAHTKEKIISDEKH